MLLKSRNLKLVEDADIKAVVEAAEETKALLKLCLLTDEERSIIENWGDFVKTSLTFLLVAQIEDIEPAARAAGPTMGVKASGGARTRRYVHIYQSWCKPALVLVRATI